MAVDRWSSSRPTSTIGGSRSSTPGCQASIGERLLAVQRHLVDEELFLANYADVLTDARLDLLVEDFRTRDAAAGFLSVRPRQTFHVVDSEGDGLVTPIVDVEESDLWINGGHFIMRPSVFDYMEPGDELVERPFERMIAAGRLMTYKHEGFWAPMDTLKDMQQLEAMYEGGRPPWVIGTRDPGSRSPHGTGDAHAEPRTRSRSTRGAGPRRPRGRPGDRLRRVDPALGRPGQDRAGHVGGHER